MRTFAFFDQGIRSVQELLGDRSVESTMIYMPNLDSGRCPMRSPLGQLAANWSPVIDGRILPPIAALPHSSPGLQDLPQHEVGEKNPPTTVPR